MTKNLLGVVNVDSVQNNSSKGVVFAINHAFEFIRDWRPIPAYEWIGYFLMFLTVPLLYIDGPIWSLSMLGTFVTLQVACFCAFFAAVMFNDYADRRVDVIVHPERPIPAGRISPLGMLALSAGFGMVGLLATAILGLKELTFGIAVALYVLIHNAYLKRAVAMPAYAELGTCVQWASVALLGFLAMDGQDLGVAILMFFFIYFNDMAHDIPGGIHDRDGDIRDGVRTWASSFGTRVASAASVSCFMITVCIACILAVLGSTGWLFPSLLSLHFGSMIPEFYRLFNANEGNTAQMGRRLNRKGFDYFLASFLYLLIDVIVSRT